MGTQARAGDVYTHTRHSHYNNSDYPSTALASPPNMQNAPTPVSNPAVELWLLSVELKNRGVLAEETRSGCCNARCLQDDWSQHHPSLEVNMQNESVIVAIIGLYTSYVKFYRLPVPVSEHDQPVGFGHVAEVPAIRAIATGAVVVHGGTARGCTGLP